MPAMTNFLRPSALALGAIVAVLSSAASAQTDEERSGARAAGIAGLEAFSGGKYDQAVDYFSRAESLMHAPTHLLYLGRANAKLGHLVSAREYYLKLTQERLPATASKPFRDAQASGDKELADLEPRLPYVSVVVQGTGGKDVQVTRDQERIPQALLGVPHPEDPGTHTFKATADGMESAPSTVLLKEGAHETVVLTLTASAAAPAAVGPTGSGQPASSGFGSEAVADTPSSGGTSAMRIASYVGMGVGAVGIGVGIYFISKSADPRNQSNALFNQCIATMSCTAPGTDTADRIHSLDSDATQKRNIGIVSVVAGGAFLATGVTLLVLDLTSHKSASAASARAVVGPTYAGIAGRF
jgi:hypothetical protein